jgi:hypothetical protein
MLVRLTEKWLNESFFSQNCFPEIYTEYRSDRDRRTKLSCGKALIAISEAVLRAKRRSVLEYFQEFVWEEITVTDDCNLLIGNHYFAPDIKADIKNYLTFVENRFFFTFALQPN